MTDRYNGLKRLSINISDINKTMMNNISNLGTPKKEVKAGLNKMKSGAKTHLRRISTMIDVNKLNQPGSPIKLATRKISVLASDINKGMLILNLYIRSDVYVHEYICVYMRIYGYT
jgi:hypothetical protein